MDGWMDGCQTLLLDVLDVIGYDLHPFMTLTGQDKTKEYPLWISLHKQKVVFYPHTV